MILVVTKNDCFFCDRFTEDNKFYYFYTENSTCPFCFFDKGNIERIEVIR